MTYRSGYPHPWEATVRRRSPRNFAAVIFRLLSPLRLKEAECPHQHKRSDDALACAEITAKRQNAGRIA